MLTILIMNGIIEWFAFTVLRVPFDIARHWIISRDLERGGWK